MRMKALRQSLVGILALGLSSVILTAGCESKADVEQLPDFAQSSATNAIGAAGSTFVAPLMEHWIASYEKIAPSVQVNYRPVGSGEGIAVC
jgi:ABC-type phosphate transport system substrate-binding protein